MRWGMALIAALSVMTASGLAHAGGWCGSAAREKSLIQCGYSTAAECENVFGKGGMCFLDPEFAANVRRNAPAYSSKRG